MQSAVIGVLIFTGIVIHWPSNATAFGWMIVVHNVMAALLVINAVIALLNALTTGSIKQFIPYPQGFFSQAIDQAVYYVKGIFLGEPHPHEKRVGARLNPLQQATYLVILNILLPGQVITGILIWGAQRWPDLTSSSRRSRIPPADPHPDRMVLRGLRDPAHLPDHHRRQHRSPASGAW